MADVFVILRIIFICGALASAQKCTPTFQNALVTVSGSVPTFTRRVSGCINSKSLGVRNNNRITIEVRNQAIDALNRAAVSDIQVEELHIIHNHIQMIKEGAFLNLPILRMLYLDNNHLTSLERYSFEGLPSLRGIYLRHNSINAIFANTFVNLPSLSMLFLDNNNLKTFNQNWFSSTPELKWLLLDDNQITFIGMAAFQDLPSLESLGFEGNKLSHIHPDAFHGLPQLSELILGKNQLSSFNIQLKELPNLYRLGINQNRFTHIPISVFDVVRNSLKEIWIYSNPLQCSCVDEFVIWGEKYNIEVRWKCEDREIYCLLPLSGETDCAKRGESEFNATYIDLFQSECLVL
uniref:LRRCT domain-containing protein n=1 Tax=Photinus pyralis TaxID=7054 RepID=A0A1Y1MSI9_PHOPY